MSSLRKQNLEKEYNYLINEYKAVHQQFVDINLEKSEQMMESLKAYKLGVDSPAKMEEARFLTREVERRGEELEQIIKPRLSELKSRMKEIKEELEQIDERQEREHTSITNRERLLDKEIELERLRRENNKASMQELDDFYNKL